MELYEAGRLAKQASAQIMKADTKTKNALLQAIEEELWAHRQDVFKANAQDIAQGKSRGMPENLIDRMMLDEARWSQILQGMKQVRMLKDPIGEITRMETTEHGLQIGKMRVALGVVGMIYEARPNVTVDAAVLSLKAGNAVMLRGSKDILESNKVITSLMRKALVTCGFDEHIITLIEDTSHETATAFMQMNKYLDVLIPRGGAGLIQNTVKHATVPVLETGTGNCHVYVDKDCDPQKVIPIILNAKTQRTSVCNACESVLLHTALPKDFCQDIVNALLQHQVKVHADAFLCSLAPNCLAATEEDYGKEYLGMEISIKMVSSLDEAIAHINHYSTHHSETILSENYSAVQKFLKEVDSACVYANASTRFSDGFEFGLGAEIGISTQKLHARGPMGLQALTSEKYIILGNGQIR